MPYWSVILVSMSLYDGWDPPRPGWVCPACGFDYDATNPRDVATDLRALLPQYARLLTLDSAVLRVRPEPSTWSALEYACHLRDCLALYDWRISKVLAEDRPELPQMGRDRVAVELRYNERVPTAVSQEMEGNYERLAELLGRLGDDDWERVGIREGVDLSVAWMAVNTLHEARHHLVDVGQVLRDVKRL
jgi:DinB superfamily